MTAGAASPSAGLEKLSWVWESELDEDEDSSSYSRPVCLTAARQAGCDFTRILALHITALTLAELHV